MGVAIGRPTADGPVIALCGDLSLLHDVNGLMPGPDPRPDVTFVVINNREYNILKKFMRSQPHYASLRADRFIAMDLVDPLIDFMVLAASMGLPARRIDRAIDIAPALEAAISSGVPNLIEIPARDRLARSP